MICYLLNIKCLFSNIAFSDRYNCLLGMDVKGFILIVNNKTKSENISAVSVTQAMH